MPTRRAVLKGLPAVAVGSFALSSTAAADHRDSVASHANIRYDQSEIERYRPKVIDPPRKNADEKAQEWYGWIVDSSEYEYTAYVYFMYYEVQRDGGVAGHRFDREPVYVFVDSEVGEVREVVYSAYHWLAEHTDTPPTVAESGGEHPTLRIVAPYNHYVLTEEDGVEHFPVKPLGTTDGQPFKSDGSTTFETWLDTGWEDALAPGVATNPARMRTRDSWWRDGRETWAVRAWAGMQVRLARAGIDTPRVAGGAPESDLA